MKTKLFGFFIFTLILILSACGGGNGDDNAVETSGSSGEDGNETADGIQKMTIKISHVVAENTPKHQGSLAIKDYIEKESDGKIKVEVYPNSSLFGDKDEYQNLVSNNVQFIVPDLSKLVGSNPQFNVPSLPFAFDNDEAAIAFWDGDKGQEILSSLEDDGVLGLYMWPNGGKHLTYNADAPIESPDGLEGLKFRTQGGQVLEAIYTELGAGSESIPFSELYTALDQGVVEGQENTFSNIESKKFDEVQDYMTIMNHTRVDYAIFTNTEFWNSMNDTTRALVEAGVKAGTEAARTQAKELNDSALEKIKEREQMEMIELTPEQVQAFRDRLQIIYDQFEDEIGADVYDAVRTANDEHGNG